MPGVTLLSFSDLAIRPPKEEKNDRNLMARVKGTEEKEHLGRFLLIGIAIA